MTLQEIKEFIEMAGKDNEYDEEDELIPGYIQLFGYTSTSIDKEAATKFAWENEKTGHQKVLFQIKWECTGSHFFLNAGAYDEEQEVLLMDGVELFVHSVEDVLDQN